MELLVKSPFEKGGFKNLQVEGINGKRYSILIAKSFFRPPLTLALSPRWGERG